MYNIFIYFFIPLNSKSSIWKFQSISQPKSLNAFTKFEPLSVTVEISCSLSIENSHIISCSNSAILSYV